MIRIYWLTGVELMPDGRLFTEWASDAQLLASLTHHPSNN